MFYSTPVELGGVTLPNRIVVSPMCQYAAVDGSAQPWHQVHYGMLSMSGAGLLCLEATHGRARGPHHTRLPRALQRRERGGAEADGRMGEGLDAPCASSASKGFAHAGRKASAQRPWKGGGRLKLLLPDLPWTAFSASAIPDDNRRHAPVALDAVGLKRVKEAFIDATLRSMRLGFYVIELHGAHGYCLHQFLSPLSNHRTDAYGGSMEKRRRFLLDSVFEACRALRRPTRRWAYGSVRSTGSRVA